MSDGADALAQLNAARQTFALRLQAARSVWDDAVAREFERQYLEPLQDQLGSQRAELERLMQVIAQARRQIR